MGKLNVSLKSALSAVFGARERTRLRDLFGAAFQPMTNTLLVSGALGIKAGAKPTAEATAVVKALIDGKLVTKAAGDLAALSGTVTNATFNVFMFTLTADGTRATAMGTAGDSLAAVKFPPIADSVCVEGFVIINPTGTGNFVGGTTDLDDGTVTPNAVFVNTAYPFNPEVEV